MSLAKPCIPNQKSYLGCGTTRHAPTNPSSPSCPASTWLALLSTTSADLSRTPGSCHPLVPCLDQPIGTARDRSGAPRFQRYLCKRRFPSQIASRASYTDSARMKTCYPIGPERTDQGRQGCGPSVSTVRLLVGVALHLLRSLVLVENDPSTLRSPGGRWLPTGSGSGRARLAVGSSRGREPACPHPPTREHTDAVTGRDCPRLTSTRSWLHQVGSGVWVIRPTATSQSGWLGRT